MSFLQNDVKDAVPVHRDVKANTFGYILNRMGFKSYSDGSESFLLLTEKGVHVYNTWREMKGTESITVWYNGKTLSRKKSTD